MAKKVLVVDDLDGSEGAETVQLSFNGNTVELDLGPKNVEKIEKFLAPYMDAGRRAKTTVVKKSKNSPPEKKAQLDAIRNWARKNGWPDLSNLGRIPQDVEDAFHAAHAPKVGLPKSEKEKLFSAAGT